MRIVKRTELYLSILFFAGTAFAEQPPASWSPQAAAAYLDGRADWWASWPQAARDHGTFCISCHTAATYAAVWQAGTPRQPLGEGFVTAGTASA